MSELKKSDSKLELSQAILIEDIQPNVHKFKDLKEKNDLENLQSEIKEKLKVVTQSDEAKYEKLKQKALQEMEDSSDSE